MKLVDEILKGLLPENEEKTVAIYAGGFKPPTKGHFQVIKQALEEHPEIDELLVYIGKKERGGITQAQSLLVWEIYANYLPLKIELIPTSTPPIKAVYNYAKNNPETSVLWIIGAREGDEDDFGDIATRTKSVDNYPNIALAVTVTKTGASGTAARNAAKISIEKLIPLLPSELSDEETVEVYNIISNNISEKIIKDKIECDNCGWSWKIKDGGNDLYICHKCDYDNTPNLGEKKGYGKSSGSRYRAVYKKNGKFYFMQDNPFSPGIRQEFGPYKTKAAALKKMGTFPPGTSYRDITENASYSKDINFKDKIIQLTKHMLDKGMNIEPLPKVKFVDGDSENARDFFGKTAYYSPDEQLIVLYTEGRHPKDIVRSFAHEMIHHIQYLEDRLGNISGTNTTEDDHLDKLEQEANLRGTMTFRNWTDSLNEGRKKKKDPKKGTGKKPEGSKRRLYTDEDPKDTIGIKFSTRQDIVDTLNKKSFKAKSHARKSQIINLIHQRVRAAYGRAKDPAVKKRLKTGLDYITKKKEASKAKTQRLKKLKEGDTYEKMAAKGKKAGSLKQGTVRKRLGISKDKKIPLSLINKEISRLKKMDKDPDKKGAQLGDKNQKYYKALQLSKTLKTTTNVNEEKVKDPFGLNAYARELATLREDDMEYKIFSDMDGVITDFDESFKKASDGIAPRDYEKKFGINKFWELIDSKGVGFWVGMPYMSDGEQYWNYIKDYDVELLSSPSRSESSRLGKRLWVRNNMPGVKLTLAYSADKQKYAAPNHILIDDRKSNIDQWVSRGGVGILHTSTADTIRQLKKLGL